jgi:hypothetical protein
MEYQVAISDLLKRYFQMTTHEKEKKGQEMAQCHELLLYFYVEYYTIEAEERRKVDLPESLMEVLGKILLERIKDKN